MTTRHDVVIVGASIAGLYCGWKLAQAGLDVCIADRRSAIGLPVRCGEATGNRAELARFIPIDESWIASDIKGLAVQVNDTFTLSREISDTGVLLHRDRFEQALAAHARSAGARIILDKRVTAPAGPPPHFTGVTLEDGTELCGNLIIAADGCESMIGQSAGITRHLAMHDAFTSLQYRIQSDRFNEGMLHFFIGSQIIPGGYIWVFPKAPGVVSVGGGLYGCSTTAKAGSYLDAFIKTYYSGCAKSGLITGCVPLAICPATLHRGNVVVVGDAARQCNPLTAGGIMNTLEAADILVRTVLAGPVSSAAQRLPAYSRAWSAKPRREQKLFYVLKDIAACSSDHKTIVLLTHAQTIFSRPIDRSRPFSWPIIPLLRLMVRLLPELLRRHRILFS